MEKEKYYCTSGCGCEYPYGDGSHEGECVWKQIEISMTNEKDQEFKSVDELWKKHHYLKQYDRVGYIHLFRDFEEFILADRKIQKEKIVKMLNEVSITAYRGDDKEAVEKASLMQDIYYAGLKDKLVEKIICQTKQKKR
jgi:hypothetical protein